LNKKSYRAAVGESMRTSEVDAVDKERTRFDEELVEDAASRHEQFSEEADRWHEE